MELKSTQTSTTAKLLMLKRGDYEMWRLKIKQYFQVQYYALWYVIKNGNSFKPVAQTTTNDAGTSTTLIPYKDAKTLFASIKTRFGGKEATKKTQKTLLKQLSGSTNKVPNAYGVSTVSTQSSTASTKAMVAIDGVGFDWSYMAEDEVPTNMALMAFLDSERSLNSLNFKSMDLSLYETESKNASKEIPNKLKKSPNAPLVKDRVPRPLNTTRPRLVYTVRPRPVDTARPRPVNIVRPRPVITVRPNTTVVNVVRVNQILKNSIEDMFPLVEEQMVAELLVKELFTLFPDENQILLRVPRRNNMYSVDMKSIVPKESLTCLVAKATLDESMLCHRRSGHINFKNINKLVKDNLVRGLPSKRFKNDQTCVACLKGKQHKASCKSKIQNSITQPLFMLHIDLFDPTFVSRLMNKKYYLVVTDDYSRFAWVFFLATKDETLGILKKFIIEIENLVDKKVKVIRCDNRMEFKNSVMNDFCAMKGKFDRKSDEGFFVGYSLNSTNSNDFVGIEEHLGKGHSSKKTRSSQDYILMPLWKDSSLFDSFLKNATNDELQSFCDAGNKDDKDVNKDSGIDAHEKSINNINDVNTVGPSINTASTDFDTGSLNINIVNPIVSTASPEATHADFLGDKPEGDMSKINTT
uniref:Putative ribonuclease H-like domain-containing protein n=1 Tax=Tanacetum cinerariifolium TaxID=118510 RepID=A0A6L2N7W7_TANCI|nr:putative ribonuclease H-like domain-containing protein [Tanacetum cinerariifolium]